MALPSTVEEDFEDFDDLNEAFETEQEKTEREAEAKAAEEAKRPRAPWEPDPEPQRSAAQEWIDAPGLTLDQRVQRANTAQDFENQSRDGFREPDIVTDDERSRAVKALEDHLNPESEYRFATAYQEYAAGQLAKGVRPTPYDDEAPFLTPDEMREFGARHEELLTGRKVRVSDDALVKVDEARSYNDALAKLREAGRLAPEGSQDENSEEPDKPLPAQPTGETETDEKE